MPKKLNAEADGHKIKRDLIKEVAMKTGVNPKIVGLVIDAFINSIKKNVLNYKLIFLRGFGKFFLRKAKAKKSHDFHKNKLMVTPEHYVFDFKPHDLLKAAAKKKPVRVEPTKIIESKGIVDVDDELADPDATSFAPRPPQN